MTQQQVFRGQIFYFVDDPIKQGRQAWHYHEDGVLWIQDGFIYKVGDASDVMAEIPRSLNINHYPKHLFMPGFIDTHVHYPQTEMIAAYGEQLLTWLKHYTFPVEQKFSDSDYAEQIANIFLNELLRNGTTTAMVFGTVHPESVDAFFKVAQRKQLRMIAGKVMMDRNAPDTLCDTAEQSYKESQQLIEKWHNVDRLNYAVTPRFAPTSTPEQLEAAARLLHEYPGVYLQTHLSENMAEIEWVHQLYPNAEHYLDVYDQAGLLSKYSIFAHGIHLCDDECHRLSQSGSAVAHCPSSNLFLGSGLFPLRHIRNHNIPVGIGTDIGGGTSFSILQTLSDAYKIQQLRQDNLSAFEAFYLATLGGAKALHLEDKIGSFLPGREADFIALDLNATPFLSYRLSQCASFEERLFVMMMLADDRVIENTWIMGQSTASDNPKTTSHSNDDSE